MIYSIALLHHLGVPVTGFRALAPLLAPGGRLVVWLYAREGNGWVLALLERLRRITRQSPLGLVVALAWVLTVPLWLVLRTVYASARAAPASALPTVRELPRRSRSVPVPRSAFHRLRPASGAGRALHVPGGGGTLLRRKRARAYNASLAPRQ